MRTCVKERYHCVMRQTRHIRGVLAMFEWRMR